MGVDKRSLDVAHAAINCSFVVSGALRRFCNVAASVVYPDAD
jgi:hypothetical protein